MKQHIATCLMLGAIGIAATAVQGQTASQSAKEAHHQEMMQGLTDAQFVQMMTKHHQHGIEMARLEEERGASASVKQLAAKIRQSQEKELSELKTHAEHHASAAVGSASSEHHRMMDQQGAMMMSRLKSASGPAVDHAFLEQMAKHHEMAIGMTEGAKLQDAELKKLAQKMLTAQRQELSELKQQLSSHTQGK